jgi:DNA-binding SARP family transcriptional activator
MTEYRANPTLLYLPLLVHDDLNVRRQACEIMLATYGNRSFTFLRRLLDATDDAIPAQASQALKIVSEISGLRVELRPFRGIYVECLGDLHVYLNGRDIRSDEWAQYDRGRAGARKVQGLFAYLIHMGAHGATPAEIGLAIWDGSVSPSSLARTLSSLRQVLSRIGSPDLAEQALTATRDIYRIEPAWYQTDAAMFERTFNLAYQTEITGSLEPAIPLYQQARELYTGPYMADLPRSNDWGQEMRDLLMNDFVIATERLAEYEYQRHHYQRCIALCREALESDPSADDVTCWALRSYARLGLRTELDRTYQRYHALMTLNSPTAEDLDSVEQLYCQLNPLY